MIEVAPVIKLKRALTIDNILSMKHKKFDFRGEWYEAFGNPSMRGTWLIWGNSGHGKTSFIIQLIKVLAEYEKVLFVSLEEGFEDTMQQSMRRVGLSGNKIHGVMDSLEELDYRLDVSNTWNIIVIDSIQFIGLGYQKYKEIKKKHHNKLFVLISQAAGKDPRGSDAESIRYDATLKIWIEGFRAISRGRYFGTKGYFNIWPEKALEHHGTL